MKHRRLVATAAAAVLMSLQMSGNAVADPPLDTLMSEDCLAMPPAPDDMVPPEAWHLDYLNMDSVWNIATGKGVTVAVIDTGVSTAGTPFLETGRVVSYDYLGGQSERDQDNGGMDCDHGTHVASLIAAARQADGRLIDGRTDFAGIAPDAEIIAYRVLSKSAPEEDGQETDPLGPTILAVRDATERGVDVINLSQSVHPTDSLAEDLKVAVEQALASGIVVVAAAGNVGGPDPSYPGAIDGVIAVGSSTREGTAHELSLPGRHVSLGAPGSDLMALAPSRPRQGSPSPENQAYADELFGTSYAAPIVSGTVALLLEQEPSLTQQEIKEHLEATADPPPVAGKDNAIGFGMVNPMRALAGAPRPTVSNPNAEATLPISPLPMPEDPDMTPAVVAVSVGAGALLLVSIGLVAAISIPAARRRRRAFTD